MTKRHDVLCQCGWGQMGMLESEIPELCPVCGFDFFEYAMLADCFEDDDDDDNDDDDDFLEGF